MKALKVTYSRLISKGNYENAKIEIELEVEQGEKAADVYEAAKNWVEKRISVEKLSDYTIEKAKVSIHAPTRGATVYLLRH